MTVGREQAGFRTAANRGVEAPNMLTQPGKSSGTLDEDIASLLEGFSTVDRSRHQVEELEQTPHRVPQHRHR